MATYSDVLISPVGTVWKVGFWESGAHPRVVRLNGGVIHISSCGPVSVVDSQDAWGYAGEPWGLRGDVFTKTNETLEPLKFTVPGPPRANVQTMETGVVYEDEEGDLWYKDSVGVRWVKYQDESGFHEWSIDLSQTSNFTLTPTDKQVKVAPITVEDHNHD